MTLPGKTLPTSPGSPENPLAGRRISHRRRTPKDPRQTRDPRVAAQRTRNTRQSGGFAAAAELAIAHAAWRQRSTDEYDASRSMAWATMMEPLLIDNPELRDAFLRDFTVAINAVEADKILDRIPFLDVSLTDRLMQASDEQIRELSAHLRSTEDLATQAREYGEIRRRLESTASGAAAGTMAPGSGSGRLPFRLDQVTLSEAARVGSQRTWTGWPS